MFNSSSQAFHTQLKLTVSLVNGNGFHEDRCLNMSALQ